MVAISRPGTWEDRILARAKTQMNAEICFYREMTPTIPYNPITGEGGSDGIAVFWRGRARVQHVRAPREFATAYQAETSQQFIFQIDPTEPGNGVPFLPSGVKARVLAGGRDSDLESLAFVTSSAINSSHMAVRTVKCSTNMEFIDWQWNPDGPDEGIFPSDGLYPSFTLYPLIG